MKLDRNLNGTGKGKYALIRLRDLPKRPQNAKELAELILEHPECVVFDEPNTEYEFFSIMLKDINSTPALEAYVKSVAKYDREYAKDVNELVLRSGVHHPNCKIPD